LVKTARRSDFPLYGGQSLGGGGRLTHSFRTSFYCDARIDSGSGGCRFTPAFALASSSVGDLCDLRRCCFYTLFAKQTKNSSLLTLLPRSRLCYTTHVKMLARPEKRWLATRAVFVITPTSFDTPTTGTVVIKLRYISFIHPTHPTTFTPPPQNPRKATTPGGCQL